MAHLGHSLDKKIYKQTSGRPMGSPLSPLISNLVMVYVKKRALLKLSFKPFLYKRYVDDIFTIVPTDKIIDNYKIIMVT